MTMVDKWASPSVLWPPHCPCWPSWESQGPASSVQFSHSVVSFSLQPHRLQYTRVPCPSPTPRPFLVRRWCHLTSSSVVPFFSCLQSFPHQRSFSMSQLFTSDGQSIGASALASVLPMNIQDWFPSGLTGLISLLSKRLSRIFSLLYPHPKKRNTEQTPSIRRGWTTFWTLPSPLPTL